MTNPVLAEVLRGGTVESFHRGSYVVCDANMNIVASAGDIEAIIFPRSAIKAFQCVPLIESGAASKYGLTDEEIALCCSSHNGETDHVRVAAAILAKSGASQSDLECGAHMPSYRPAMFEIVKRNSEAQAIHNNCSGKHAGMLALAAHRNAPREGYTSVHHPVQTEIATTISKLCDFDLFNTAVGVDGCSVPTWALPFRNIGLGFARIAQSNHKAGQRIIDAARKYPFMISGTKSFDTEVMQNVPRLFIKVGAEGVYCGCIPHMGLGFAMKCDDGASRAAEVAIAGTLAKLDVWTPEEKSTLLRHSTYALKNWRKIEVGEVRCIS